MIGKTLESITTDEKGVILRFRDGSAIFVSRTPDGGHSTAFCCGLDLTFTASTILSRHDAILAANAAPKLPAFWP